MPYTYEQLKHKTVAELREIAAGLPEHAIQGYTQMNKEHLLQAVCGALHIDMHAHHEVVGIDKSRVKAKIRELKRKRGDIQAAHDPVALAHVRHQIHVLKRKLHKATV